MLYDLSWAVWRNICSHQIGHQRQTKELIPPKVAWWTSGFLVHGWSVKEHGWFKGSCITKKPTSAWSTTREWRDPTAPPFASLQLPASTSWALFTACAPLGRSLGNLKFPSFPSLVSFLTSRVLGTCVPLPPSGERSSETPELPSCLCNRLWRFYLHTTALKYTEMTLYSQQRNTGYTLLCSWKEKDMHTTPPSLFKYTNIHRHTHKHRDTRTHIYIYIHTHKRLHIHICIHTQIHNYKHTCTQCTRTCIFIHTYTTYTRAHIDIHSSGNCSHGSSYK